jgi:hypothetical protein
VVDTGNGEIYIACGVALGAGDGPNGSVAMAGYSFNKIGDCNNCVLCFEDDNPRHTILVDNEGQPVKVLPRCSKDISDNNVVDVNVPDNIKTNSDCNKPTAAVSWDPPTAKDDCGEATLFCRGVTREGLVYSQADILDGGVFPQGISNFCCYAVSDWKCHKIGGCPPDTDCERDAGGKPIGCWTVEVTDETSMDIEIGLEPGSGKAPAGLKRAITFTVYPNCIQEPVTFCEEIIFGESPYQFLGKFQGKIKIPKGQWDCMTAEDQLHTLRSCYMFEYEVNGGDCFNGQLHARFKGDPRLGGNWLIGGNLDGWKKDNPNASLYVIDILDYGQFVATYGDVYLPEPGKNYGDTQCETAHAGPNGDISGDGVVDLDDYIYISRNFLTSAKDCCCGPVAATAGLTEISVRELRQMGLSHLAVADLNGDGLLNLDDMTAFDQGVRPVKQQDGKGSGARSTGSR